MFEAAPAGACPTSAGCLPERFFEERGIEELWLPCAPEGDVVGLGLRKIPLVKFALQASGELFRAALRQPRGRECMNSSLVLPRPHELEDPC